MVKESVRLIKQNIELQTLYANVINKTSKLRQNYEEIQTLADQLFKDLGAEKTRRLLFEEKYSTDLRQQEINIERVKTENALLQHKVYSLQQKVGFQREELAKLNLRYMKKINDDRKIDVQSSNKRNASPSSDRKHQLHDQKPNGDIVGTATNKRFKPSMSPKHEISTTAAALKEKKEIDSSSSLNEKINEDNVGNMKLIEEKHSIEIFQQMTIEQIKCNNQLLVKNNNLLQEKVNSLQKKIVFQREELMKLNKKYKILKDDRKVCVSKKC